MWLGEAAWTRMHIFRTSDLYGGGDRKSAVTPHSRVASLARVPPCIVCAGLRGAAATVCFTDPKKLCSINAHAMRAGRGSSSCPSNLRNSRPLYLTKVALPINRKPHQVLMQQYLLLPAFRELVRWAGSEFSAANGVRRTGTSRTDAD